METAPLISLTAADLLQEEHVVLQNVNLEAKAGEFIYLIGKTGSGKSSLLKTLYGELPLTSGQGSVCGVDLTELKQRKVHLLRRKLGIVFQDFELLTDRTAIENLQFVLKVTDWKDPGDREHRVAEVLEAVGLENKGYKRPFELSGGERQRLAIARALLNSPELILADEPTGNLDSVNSDIVLGIFKDIAKVNDQSLLIVTHDHDFAKATDRTIVMQDGKILSDIYA